MVYINCMNNKWKTLTILSLCGLLSTMTTASALTFSDLREAHRNYTAIQYLSEKNIIKGYPDGTFQPQRTISRAEFLKIALESSKIALDVEESSSFSDVDENAWYGKYVKKAKKEGWIQGYLDGTFKPSQQVNKVEGLKMIAAIQKWPLVEVVEAPYQDTPALAWYARYVTYAKTKNFLEETGQLFSPSANLSRGGVSEILFRALITEETKSGLYSEDLINKTKTGAPDTTVTTGMSLPVASVPLSSAIPSALPSPPVQEKPAIPPEPAISPAPELNFAPVGYRTYSKDFFDNVSLNENFPNTFYMNEVYYFDGAITGGTYKSAFVFSKAEGDANSKNSVGAVTDNRFSIPFVFQRTGSFKLGLILGNSGVSKIANISVLPGLPKENTLQTATAPQNPKIQFKNQKTTLNWENSPNQISRVVFFQDTQSKVFFFRQKKNTFDLTYSDFKDFRPGRTYFQIQSAVAFQTLPLGIDSPWVKAPAQEFTATNHNAPKNEPDYITYDNIPELVNPMETITFSATAKADLLVDAAVIKPDGKVETLKLQTSAPTTTYFNSTVIPAGSSLTFQYATTQAGTHIIEINEKNGSAAINMAIYPKDTIPFVPDFFDLQENETQPAAILSLDDYRKQLLDLINQERTNAGLKIVAQDDQLNTLAQNHANDMATRNFFGHVNPDNQTPDMRRLAQKIPTDVGENLAKTPSLLYAHYGLMRSAVHRKNVLNSRWQRVGIGMVKSGTNDLITVQEFSTLPLTADDINTIKTAMLSKINEKRTAAGLKALVRGSILDGIADGWSLRMVKENFFAFTAPDAVTLSNVIQNTITPKAVQAFILKSNSQEKLITEISDSPDVLKPNWAQAGIGLMVDDTGVLKLTVLYVE